MAFVETFKTVLESMGVKITLCTGFFLIFVGIFTPIYNKLFKKELNCWKQTSFCSVLAGFASVIVAVLLSLFFNDGLSAVSICVTEILPILAYCIIVFFVVTLCRYAFLFGTHSETVDSKKIDTDK